MREGGNKGEQSWPRENALSINLSVCLCVRARVLGVWVIFKPPGPRKLGWVGRFKMLLFIIGIKIKKGERLIYLNEGTALDSALHGSGVFFFLACLLALLRTLAFRTRN